MPIGDHSPECGSPRVLQREQHTYLPRSAADLQQHHMSAPTAASDQHQHPQNPHEHSPHAQRPTTVVMPHSPVGISSSSHSNSSSGGNRHDLHSPSGETYASLCSRAPSRSLSFNMDNQQQQQHSGKPCQDLQQQQQQQYEHYGDLDQDRDQLAVLRSAEQAVSARLLPPLLLLVMVSYIDRTNLSFASIQLSQDLQLSSTMYGVGSGVFFLAYALGQIPSNLLLLRFGGPTWLAAITLAWGAVASAFALVRGPVSFILLRLLLGLAESGSLPGTWYYISLFYPADRTTVPYSLIETGITVSQVIGAPFAAGLLLVDGVAVLRGWQWLFIIAGIPTSLLLQVIAAPFAAGLLLLDGVAGLRGWQWLFLIEGIPALMLGCFIRYWLPSSVASASFLSHSQKAALTQALAAAAAAKDADNDNGDLISPNAALLLQTAAVDSELGSDQNMFHTRNSTAAAAAKGSAAAAAAAGGDHGPEQQSLLTDKHNLSDTAGDFIVVQPMCGSSGQQQQQQQQQRSAELSCNRTNWQKFVAVAKNRVVLYAGCWRILHDIPGNGILYWTPKIVQALLVAAGSAAAVGAAGSSSSSRVEQSKAEPQSSSASSTGAYVVLLSAIPYAAASLFHLLNAWHSQKQCERKWHIGLTWLGGAVALLLLPAAAAGGLAAADASAAAISTTASVAAFVLLTVAHIGINGANGVQTGLVAGSIVKQDKALGLALYNMIGNVGSFWGPVLIGILHDATGGYVLAMVLLGFSLAAAAAMVVRFRPEKLDRRLLQEMTLN